MIIGLSGFAGSGKDYVCQKLIESMPQHLFKRFALADFLKELMCIILDCNYAELEAQKEELRPRLIKFSEGGIKRVDKQFWIKYFHMFLKKNPGNYIITDIRYWEEFHYSKLFFPRELLLMVGIVTVDFPININCGNEIMLNACDWSFQNYEDVKLFQLQLDRLTEKINHMIAMSE